MSGRRRGVIAGVHVVTLAGFAIAQPLFDQLARAPALLYVHHATRADVLLVTALLCLGIPAVLLAVEGAASLLGHRVRAAVHALVVATLVALIVLPPLVREVPAPDGVLLAGAALAGGLFTVGYLRARIVRDFVTVLTPAPAIFAGLFLSGAPAGALPPPPAPTATGSGRAVPIVLIVLDELSTTALMDERRAIDTVRFPNFAALADHATWYRNATTIATRSEIAVGSILTGRLPDAQKPDWAELRGHNLFALVRDSHRMRAVEGYMPFCPTALCARDAAGSLRARVGPLVSDLGATFLHVVAPPHLRRRLPGLSHPMLLLTDPSPAGGAFNAAGVLAVQRERHYTESRQRGAAFQEFVDGIEASAVPTLHYLHTLLPHEPSIFLPSGRICPSTASRDPYAWDDDPLRTGHAYQRHLLQVQFVDHLIGTLMTRLRETGLWDETLVIVVADHGVSFRPNTHRRAFTETTLCDVMAVPLFVKLPGQRRGGANDRNVETIDLLPTIADVLGLEVPWDVDGHSLLRANAPARPHKVLVGPSWPAERPLFGTRGRVLRPPALSYDCLGLPDKRSVVRRGQGRGLVVHAGPYAGLIGRRLGSGAAATESGHRVAIEEIERYRGSGTEGPTFPCLLRGEIQVAADAPPQLPLAIAIAGTVRALARATPTGPRTLGFESVVTEEMLEGDARPLEVFEVSGRPSAPVLARVPQAGQD